MKDIELIDINEDDLPNVSLTDDELLMVSKLLIKKIKRLQEDNIKYSLNCSPTNVGKIVSSLGDKAKEKRLSVEYFNVLKELVIQGIDNQNPIKEEDIIFKGFLYTPASHTRYLPPTWVNANYYYYVYLTNKDLTLYSLDVLCKVLNKTTIPLEEIIYVDIVDSDTDGTKLTAPNLMIKAKTEGISVFASGYYLLGENPYDTTYIESLEALLKERTTNTYERKDYTKPILKFVFIALLIQSIISLLLFYN